MQLFANEIFWLPLVEMNFGRTNFPLNGSRCFYKQTIYYLYLYVLSQPVKKFKICSDEFVGFIACLSSMKLPVML